jgi:hypothetical protein
MASRIVVCVVAVRRHLVGMELLLSSRYTVPLRCSYCCNNREHEFLDLREFLRVIELLRVVQENSLVYSKQKNTVTRAMPGTEIYTLYWATPRAEVLYVLLRPLPGTEVPLWRCE